MKNYKTKTSFVRSEGPKAQLYETGINFLRFFFNYSSLYDAIHDFSLRLRNGSNPVDINPLIGFEVIYWI